MSMNTSPQTQTKPYRILVIKFRHHGDMLLITPVLHALKAQYPDANIDVLLYEETRDMLAANPDIHQIFAIDRRWKKQGTRYYLQKQWHLLKQIGHQRYDIVLNLADQWHSAIFTKWSGAQKRLGFAFEKRQHPFWKFCHTDLVSTQDHSTKHTVEQNLSLLAPLGISHPNAPATMHYRAEDWRICENLLPKEFCEGYIVIQPTSRWFFKCWREKKMSEVINALTEMNQRVVLTSGPDPKELAMTHTIAAACDKDRVISLAGQLTLPQLAALIAHARLFIGVDSVPMHMAAALKTPLIALFGPSKLTFWRPWQANGEVIWAGDYGPLPDPDEINTQTNERYLDAIPSQAVIDAARRLLS